MATTNLEYWLRGPVEKIPALLQPVAHALLQASDEISISLVHFPEKYLWLQPGGTASVGFHLQHVTGVLDRLFTYARGESLSEIQLAYLKQEGKEPLPTVSSQQLLSQFNQQVAIALLQLVQTNENTLTDKRGVGRAQVPSTVMGLLFHAAEHTMRHTGQLLVTIKWVTAQP